MTIPAGPGNSRRQIKLAKDFRTTVAHILPSYALILGEHLRNMGEDPRAFPLRIALVGAEPYTEEFRKRIEELFDMKAYNSYGLSEMNGPAWALNALSRTACTSGRTPIFPKSWIRTPASPCRTARWVSWS